MTYARYYPSVVTLPDGNAMVFSGTNGGRSATQDIPERYDRQTNTWTPVPAAQITLPYYPSIYVLPDGRLVNTNTSEDPVPTRVLNPANNTWTVVDNDVQSTGTSIMYLPGKILRAGTGANPNETQQSVGTAQVLDMMVAQPQWRLVQSMAFPRAFHTMVSLPDGTVLVTGGGRTSSVNDTALAVHEAEIWDPVSETWSTMAAMQTPRLYHQTSLLLPDGRVLVAGSGRPGGQAQLSADFYSPPYLFKGPRPTITSAPAQVSHNTTFFVGTPDGTRIARVALIRLGSTTHAFNSDQRYLDLTFQQASGGLTVQAPADANLAIPGNYMLFLVDSNGVPSVASMVAVPGTWPMRARDHRLGPVTA